MQTSPIRRVRRALWFAAAAVVILAAVLLSLTRLLLPSLQSYRTDVERKVSALIGQPVRIRTLDAHLLGLAPTVILEDVRLLNRQGTRTVAHFRQARISIDVLASLRQHRAVMSELTVVGAELTLLRLPDGRLKIQGLTGGAAPAAAAKVDGIGRWLLSQGRLALFDSRVHWHDLATGRKVELRRVDIELRNSNARHQLNIDVQLPPGMGRRLHLALDLSGNVLQPDGWSGDAYLSADELRPTPLWNGAVPGSALTIERGRFNLHLWGSWQAGRLTDVVGKLAATDLALRRDKHELALTDLSTALHWHQASDGWVLGLGDLTLQRGSVPAQPVQVRVRHQGEGWFVQASAINLGDAAAIVPFVPGIAASQQAEVAAIRPRGTVRRLRLDLPAQGPPHVQGVAEHLAAAPWRQVPGFDNLSGQFAWTGADGQLLLDGSDVTIDIRHLFRAPLVLQRLQGDIELHHGVDGWRVTAQQLRLGNPDLQANVAATLTLPPQGSPYLDLRGHFWNGQAARTSHYLPAAIMDPDALAWLDHAFGAGTVTDGDVLFHGPLGAFPFDHGQGRFEVGFHVQNAELFFRAGWPRIKQLDAQVAFVNRRMTIRADSGTMFDSRIQRTTVTIADLELPLLAIRGAAQLRGSDALRLLSDTPLQRQFGSYVAGMRLDGDSQLKLSLDVPLTKRVAALHPLTLNGSVGLQNNRLQVSEGFSVDAISGLLRFSGTGLRADRIQARILDQPATVAVHSIGHGSTARTVSRGSGQLDSAALSRLYPTPLATRVSGRTTWHGSLTIPHGGGAVLRIVSELNGVAVKLPKPLNKSAAGKRRLEVVRYFSGPRAGQLEVRYSNRASLLLLLNSARAVTRGTLRLGRGTAHLPTRNVLRISGSLSNFDPALWTDAVPGGGRGMVALPLLVDMDTLHIVGGKGLGKGKGGWQSIPTLDVAIKHFGFDKYRFGRLAFHLEHSKDALQLRNLLLTGTALKLTGQARWQWRPRSYSEVKLQLASDDVAALTHQFHIASVITRGKLQSRGEFHWPGPLTHGDLRQIGGHIYIKIEDGQMADVDPGAGRLLGLFSLQALPQHLTLDFRDLFQKGLVFNSFEGDTTIRGGNAYTSNLVMKAPSATIHIEGRTGLVKRDFDQLITVVPNLSGTAPVVGALAFGPQIGAAIYLFERLLGKKVDQAAKTQYKVTGSWDKPVFTRLQPEKKKAPPATHTDYP